MRLSLRTLAVAAVVGLGSATTASAEISESLANHIGRWTGYGWSEGYHAYDACPSCGHRGHGFHHHGGGAAYRARAAGYGPSSRHITGPTPAHNLRPLHLFPSPSEKSPLPTSVTVPPSHRASPLSLEQPLPRGTSSPAAVRPSTKAGPLPPPQPMPHAASQASASQEESHLAPLLPPSVIVSKPSGSAAPLPGRHPLAR